MHWERFFCRGSCACQPLNVAFFCIRAGSLMVVIHNLLHPFFLYLTGLRGLLTTVYIGHKYFDLDLKSHHIFAHLSISREHF
jgi:hypothetical protein